MIYVDAAEEMTSTWPCILFAFVHYRHTEYNKVDGDDDDDDDDGKDLYSVTCCSVNGEKDEQAKLERGYAYAMR